jgi:hypothetical protein
MAGMDVDAVPWLSPQHGDTIPVYGVGIRMAWLCM